MDEDMDERNALAKELLRSGIIDFSSNPVYDPPKENKWTQELPFPDHKMRILSIGRPYDPADIQRMRRQQHEPHPLQGPLPYERRVRDLIKVVLDMGFQEDEINEALQRDYPEGRMEITRLEALTELINRGIPDTMEDNARSGVPMTQEGLPVVVGFNPEVKGLIDRLYKVQTSRLTPLTQPMPRDYIRNDNWSDDEKKVYDDLLRIEDELLKDDMMAHSISQSGSPMKRGLKVRTRAAEALEASRSHRMDAQILKVKAAMKPLELREEERQRERELELARMEEQMQLAAALRRELNAARAAAAARLQGRDGGSRRKCSEPVVPHVGSRRRITKKKKPTKKKKKSRKKKRSTKRR